MSITFTLSAAEKIKRVVEQTLRQDRSTERTTRVTTEASFWGLITGLSPGGIRYHFLRVYPVADNDSAADFVMKDGPAYRIADADPELGFAREVNGKKSVPSMTVVRCEWVGYDADGQPNYLFQWVGPDDDYYLRPHDHRDNFNGGFAFSCFHPGTGLPQQPFAV